MENFEKDNLNEKDIKTIIAHNIAKYRKINGLTQLELAEKLNYSDKTLSKWERGDAIPDIITLKQIADLFEISVEHLISDENSYTEFKPLPGKKGKNKRSNLSISLLSLGIVWLVATIVFVFLMLLPIDFSNSSIKPWIVFIYAIPVSAIVLLVFASIWGNNVHVFLTTSSLLWSLALSVHLTFNMLDNSYLIYIIPIPLQIMAFIYFIMLKKDKKHKH